MSNIICVASHHKTIAELLTDSEFVNLSKRKGFLIELRLDGYEDLSLEKFRKAVATFGNRNIVSTFRCPEEGGQNLSATIEDRKAYWLETFKLNIAYLDIELCTLESNAGLIEELNAAREAAGGTPDPEGDMPPLDDPDAAEAWDPSQVINTKYVISFHDFKKCPSLTELRDLRTSAEKIGADIVKFAVTAADVHDTLPLVDLMLEPSEQIFVRERKKKLQEGGKLEKVNHKSEPDPIWDKPFLGIAMGESGFFTRVLGPIFPNPAPFAFARGCNAPGTAPGQATWKDLLLTFNYRMIAPGMPVFGVIGNPIGHSLSPQMHNAALQKKGADGVYLPFKIVDDPVRFVNTFGPRINLRGLSVTIPHKEEIQKAATIVDELVTQIGAANTLVRRDQSDQPGQSNQKDGTIGWFATNTDATAAAGSLEKALGGTGSLKEKNVLILGAGGAAKATAFGVKQLGANVYIYNRTTGRATQLAADVGGKVLTKDALVASNIKDNNVSSIKGGFVAVINTTPLGMYPNVDTSPLEKDQIPEGALVFDTVYNPFKTKLLQLTEEKGQATLEGLNMFIGQGAVQFELFTGQTAPWAVMEKVVRNALSEKAND